METFPAVRYMRAGATPEQVAEHASRFDAMTDDEQHGRLEQIARLSDREIHRLYLNPPVEATDDDIHAARVASVQALLDVKPKRRRKTA